MFAVSILASVALILDFLSPQSQRGMENDSEMLSLSVGLSYTFPIFSLSRIIYGKSQFPLNSFRALVCIRSNCAVSMLILFV
jgi:hypothetical protein